VLYQQTPATSSQSTALKPTHSAPYNHTATVPADTANEPVMSISSKYRASKYLTRPTIKLQMLSS